MSDELPSRRIPAPTVNNPVHCASCYKFNERETEKCVFCGAHLWIKCRRCGKRNVRTASRCSQCRHRLRGVSLRRLRRFMQLDSPARRYAFIALLAVLGLGLGLQFISAIASGSIRFTR